MYGNNALPVQRDLKSFITLGAQLHKKGEFFHVKYPIPKRLFTLHQ